MFQLSLKTLAWRRLFGIEINPSGRGDQMLQPKLDVNIQQFRHQGSGELSKCFKFFHLLHLWFNYSSLIIHWPVLLNKLKIQTIQILTKFLHHLFEIRCIGMIVSDPALLAT